jgi:hypothetical protein
VTSYSRQARDALTRAARAEHDFPGWLAGILAGTATRLGSSDALIAGRPGSWEADLVDQLVKGTVGYADEYLPDPVAEDAEDDAGEEEASPPPAGLDAGRLAAIRAVLARFGWQAGDRQQALEQIGQIVSASHAGSGPGPGGAAVITPADLGTLRQALADAIAWRTPPTSCPACQAYPYYPEGRCDDHTADLDQAGAYLQLVAELGIEADR